MEQTIYDTLNERQYEAVFSDDNNILITAGAGTGKTRTIVARIIRLVEKKAVPPENIVALTFTNKAAKEMKNRVDSYFGDDIGVTIKTFHSLGAYILRNSGGFRGRTERFNIYDDDDSLKMVKSVLERDEYQELLPYEVKKDIARYKQSVETGAIAGYDFQNIYDLYDSALRESNAFDFEDLILKCVDLLRTNPAVKSKYADRFRYILADEYQDTNASQFELLKALSGADTHTTVVGDEDQSIYKFRGATIENILNFQREFVPVKIIKLERNYRSTKQILDLANSVIKNNIGRIDKNLYSKSIGDKPALSQYEDENEEASRICSAIIDKALSLKDTAILYRTNWQARVFETVLRRKRIPYVVFGAQPYFQREEIKDVIAVLKWLFNPKDKIAFERFVNKPARGIGKKGVLKFYELSTKFDNNLLETLKNIDSFAKEIKNLDSFLFLKNIFEESPAVADNRLIDSDVSSIMNDLGLIDYYKNLDSKDGGDRIYNINDLSIYLAKYEGDVAELLEEISLDANKAGERPQNALTLSTVHNAKGLEYENVFVAGLEEETFPHRNSIGEYDEEDDVDEERRLFYVALTRAKKRLFVSYCSKRSLFGLTKVCRRSRFLSEIEEGLLEEIPRDDCLTEQYGEPEYRGIKKGVIVKHKDYGSGKIVNILKKNNKHLATIDFYDYSIMEMILEFTKLEIKEDTL
ncbi:MAG TPA: ATP-dependent helicase [Spirochaetota bacterium]|jgi:DNA helicase-2/ATP-dependent DNA helicase PcrA|nr:MAG: ATP-dependent DNA helicase PcrA [Spirochaetes bacterium ADurb.Bin133]HPY87357.1 ATP-dependent helicase [Spirochaetota bacterium]HQB60732.1 ATP-dependent helicase [Spirochaetota bacterium]